QGPVHDLETFFLGSVPAEVHGAQTDVAYQDPMFSQTFMFDCHVRVPPLLRLGLRVNFKRMFQRSQIGQFALKRSNRWQTSTRKISPQESRKIDHAFGCSVFLNQDKIPSTGTHAPLDVRLVKRMRPSQIGSHEDRARRPCRSPAVLQGLTGIVIPSRKTQARQSGQLCSIRGKSGGARSEAKPYRRVEQTTGQSTSRLELQVAVGFALFFSSPWYAYVW